MARHAVVQCCCMFVISSAAIGALAATALGGEAGRGAGGGANEVGFYVLWGVSAAYFVGDFVYLAFEEPQNWLVMAHHVVALAALGFMFSFVQFRLFMIIIGLQEISTFFMFLKRVDGMAAWKAELEVAFLLCWAAYRVMLSPLLVAGAVVVLVENVSAAGAIHLGFQTFFMACNVYWTVEIVKSRWSRSRSVLL